MKFRGTTTERLDRVEQAVKELAKDFRQGFSMLLQGESIIMTELTDQLDQAEANATRETSAEAATEALLTKLSAMVKALGSGVTDPALVARIKALSDGIAARADAMAAAVVANTPAEEAPTSGGGVPPSA